MKTTATFVALLCCFVGNPGSLAAAPFAVTNLTVAPGTGDKVIAAFYPTLIGSGQGPAIEQQLNLNLQQSAASLTDMVNQRITGVNFPDFAKRSANAMALSGEQIAVDDASHFDLFSLGIGASVAVNPADYNQLSTVAKGGSQRLADGQSIGFGFGAATAVSLGINLAPFAVPNLRYFDFHKLSVFAHLRAFSDSMKLGNDTQAQFAYSAWGFAGRYRLLSPINFVPHGLVRWGGLSVGSGFNATSIDVKASATLAQQTQTNPLTLNGKALNLNLAFGSTSNLEVRLGAMSIPLEVSSSMQLGYLLTFYGGAGLDFNFGSSKVVATSTAPLTLTLADPQTGRSVDAGNPLGQLSLQVVRHPLVVDVRGMFGLQLNFGVVGLYAQVQANSASTVGLNTGLRAFW